MFYRLNDKFLLRGWQKLPYAVIDRTDGCAIFTNKEIMDVLLMANGKIDFDIPMISDAQRELAGKLVDEGTIFPCDTVSSISENQNYRFHDNRYMEVAHWSITGRCNYKCKHCYMSACNNKYDELPTEDIMKIIDELYECGIHRVSITGGEALVRKDFWDIVDALIAHDIVIFCLYSNGQLINENTLHEFEKRNLYPEINMSFDGTEGWHSWLRGVPGADETIDRAFRICKEHGFPTGAEMCLHDGNKHTIRDSVNYLAGVGCQNLKIVPICNVGAWYENGYGKSISLEELFDCYLEYIPQYLEDGKPLFIQLGGFFSMSPRSDEYTIPVLKPHINPDMYCVCGHARNNMYISAEGRALPCMSLSGMNIQNEYPYILEHGLKYCLTESSYIDLVTKKASDVIKHNERCRDCEYATRCCGGCRAAALEYYPNDIMAIDESSCLFMKAGYIDKIEEAVRRVSPTVVLKNASAFK